jgi:hypothetical protein
MADDNVKVAADQAYATLVNELAAPYFFEKLAAHGIQPASATEAEEIWSAAGKLHTLYNAAREKEAAASTTKLAAMNSRLDEMLYGRRPANTDQQKTAAFFAAADVAANEAHIANAVLTLQAANYAALQSGQETE